MTDTTQLEQEFDTIDELIQSVGREMTGKRLVDRFVELGQQLGKFINISNGGAGGVTLNGGAGGAGAGGMIAIGGGANGHTSISAGGIGIFTSMGAGGNGGSAGSAGNSGNVGNAGGQGLSGVAVGQINTMQIVHAVNGPVFTLPAAPAVGEVITVVNTGTQPCSVQAPNNIVYYGQVT